MNTQMAATQELLPPTTAPSSPTAPPLSSIPAPVSTYVPPPTLAPPVVRVSEVEAHVHVEPAAEPLFAIKVWQLGFAVIVVMAAALYFLGII